MCHVSVGHVARAVEAAGIPTVTVMAGAFGFRALGMKLPRSVITRHIGGRPIGAPGDVERQRHVVRKAFALLETATANSTVLELPEPYRTAP